MTFHLKAVECCASFLTQRILQDKSHVGHKANFGKFEKIEIVSNIFF